MITQRNQTGTDTYTAPGNGTIIALPDNPVQSFSILVVGTGAAPTAWEVVLEGSNNGVNFTTILTHKNDLHINGETRYTGANHYPSLYYRSRCVSVTLGSATDIVAIIVGMA